MKTRLALITNPQEALNELLRQRGLPETGHLAQAEYRPMPSRKRADSPPIDTDVRPGETFDEWSERMISAGRWPRAAKADLVKVADKDADLAVRIVTAIPPDTFDKAAAPMDAATRWVEQQIREGWPRARRAELLKLRRTRPNAAMMAVAIFQGAQPSAKPAPTQREPRPNHQAQAAAQSIMADVEQRLAVARGGR